MDDPFVVPVNRKGKAKAQQVDSPKKEVADELEDEDEIFEDEQLISDHHASGPEDDGKLFVYQEDLHKRR